MRPLIFRAWDEELKIMLEPVDLSSPLQNYKWLGRNDLPIMQFTGLKDKNGKDIYEDDILEHSDGIVVITWSQKYSCFDAVFADNVAVGAWEICDLSVVGNIHENPDLLSIKL